MRDLNFEQSVALDAEKLALVKDAHVAIALRLEAAFGLLREEAIKFTPARDDRGDRIRLKGSTTEGGRWREVPCATRCSGDCLTRHAGWSAAGADPAGAQLQAAAQGLREPDAGGRSVLFDMRMHKGATRNSRTGSRRRRAGRSSAR